MSPKKVNGKASAQKKMMSIELKQEIIEKKEQGARVADLARQYGRSTSTICTVLKQKESIKSITPAKGVTIISKLRSSLHEKMEKLLMVWLTEKQRSGDTLTQSIICDKARAIYGDLLNQTPRNSTDEASEDSFKASRGWFDNFRRRTGIHSLTRHDEATSSDMEVAFEGFEPEVLLEEEVVCMGESMGPRMDERHMNELADAHPQEPTTEELQELQSQQHSQVLQEIGEPEVEEAISTSEIKEILGMWERVSQFVGKKHPEKVATVRASELFNDTCLTHFRNILKKRKKQTSLNSFLNPEKKAKASD